MQNEIEESNPHSSDNYSNNNFSESEEESIIIEESKEQKSFINTQVIALMVKNAKELKARYKKKKFIDWKKKRINLLVKGKSTTYFKEYKKNCLKMKRKNVYKNKNIPSKNREKYIMHRFYRDLSIMKIIRRLRLIIKSSFFIVL